LNAWTDGEGRKTKQTGKGIKKGGGSVGLKLLVMRGGESLKIRKGQSPEHSVGEGLPRRFILGCLSLPLIRSEKKTKSQSLPGSNGNIGNRRGSRRGRARPKE